MKDIDLISEKYKKTCKYFNYVEQLLILAWTITGCVSIGAFTSLVCVPFFIENSAVVIKVCTTTARIKKYSQL